MLRIPVYAFFAIFQKGRPNKKFWAFVGVKEMTGGRLAQIRLGSDCSPPSSTHTVKPYQKNGNSS